MNARDFTKIELQYDIDRVVEVLKTVDKSDVLQVVAEALLVVKEPEVEYQSCVCFDWDITMDYRNAEERK
jgi:hypothetical protein